jgi:hypothetical protein
VRGVRAFSGGWQMRVDGSGGLEVFVFYVN